MRSETILKTILLNNIELFNSGLCAWISNLCAHHLITVDERDYLHEKVRNNRPKFIKIVHSIYNPDKINHYGKGFYWEQGTVEPRIKWIKKYLIK